MKNNALRGDGTIHDTDGSGLRHAGREGKGRVTELTGVISIVIAVFTIHSYFRGNGEEIGVVI